MIRVQWQKPTERHFLCRFVDGSGANTAQVREGDSAAAVRAELEREVEIGRIQSVTSVEPFDYAKWKTRAANATCQVMQEPEPGQKRSFNSDIWTELKAYLIWLFHGKCAYCEGKFGAVARGDVEHYRPKARVTGLDDAVLDHPGYYWLAYEPSNLMPACENCNRAGAKMNRFPVADEAKRVAAPGAPLDDEEPLLLNPYAPDLDWRKHFTFETSRGGTVPGLVRPLTPQGEASIRAYRLQRTDLIDARAKEQQAILPMMQAAVGAGSSLRDQKRQFKEGTAAYSAAALSEFEYWEKQVLGDVIL